MARQFVLVHEACLGPWSWDHVTERLKSQGHLVTAVRLANAETCQRIQDYFLPLTNIMENLHPGEKVILVGHGRGGLAISFATENYHQHVSVGVYVAALAPSPVFPISAVNELYNPSPEFYMDSIIKRDPSGKIISILFGPRFLKEKVYQLSPERDLEGAKRGLRTYPYFDDERSADALKLTNDNYGAVPRIYIKCVKDEMIPIHVQQQMISRNAPDKVQEIPDSDHMPKASKPEDLFAQLHSIALRY